MLKITNSQNNYYQNRVFQAKQPEIVVSTNPIEKSPQMLSNIYYQPVSFGRTWNKTAQGKHIAANLNTIIHENRGAIDTPEFSNELKKLNTKNILQTVKTYKENSNKSLFSDILDETGSSRDVRKDAVTQIFDLLSKKGEEKGVQSEHYKKNFDIELKTQMESFLPINTKKLAQITNGLLQAIDNKSSLTVEEKTALKLTPAEKLQNYTTDVLTNTVTKAEKSFTKQVNHDGFFAKVADGVSVLWNSKNRKELVQQDIDTYKEQISTLKNSKNDKDFKENFKEIFNVDYDPELVAAYKNKEVELQTAIIATGIEQTFKKSMKDLISNKSLQSNIDILAPAITGATPVITTKETKEQVYQRNYETLAEYIGIGDKENGKTQLEKKFKEYGLKENSTDDEKFSVMQKIANKKANQLELDRKTVTKGKTLSQIKKEYNASYNATFGVDNDIAKRVTDYNISQQIGEYAVDALIMGPVMIGIGLATAGTGLLPAVNGAVAATATNMAVYSADRVSSKNGMTKDDIVDVLKYSVLDGATFIGSALAYQGIKFFTSAAFKASKTAAKITEITLLTAAETGMDACVEKTLESKVEIDGIHYSATFSLAGQLLELKLLR